MRVLLVEDTDDLRLLFVRVLKGCGCEVVAAADGRAALELVAAWRPELVLTDLMMPGMDGAELIGRLRAMPGMDAVPMVAITADSTLGAERRARLAGAVDCLIKPVDLTAIVGRFGDDRRTALRMA